MGASDSELLEETRPATYPAAPWPLLARLPAQLAAEAEPAAWRELLRQAHEELKARFVAEEPVEELVHARAALIDAALREAWRTHCAAQAGALVAVGGYGRGELQPCSDIDILLLVPEPPDAPGSAVIGTLVAFLWDIGLEVGHSVRTVEECAQESVADVSVMTTLIEARLLAGRAELLAAMRDALSAEHVWPVKEFFDAKVREQAERHLKAHDTAYNLERNVKTGPGGLRDIQTIAWVPKRHFGSETLDGLATRGFLSVAELRRLKQAQAFLWKVRFGLHVLTGRREDRLLFDHQIRLAQTFGYEDASYTLAVEQFMQRYYRTVMDVSLLNELLLQLFREAILNETDPPRPLNPRFQMRNGSLEAVSDDIFVRTPSTLLELFVLLQQNPEINGVRASTMRAVARSLWLIDEEFRQNPRHHRLFLEILRSPVGVTHELRRMNTYGVLGRYIPAFGRIVGRMQYDLFHAYTVDAHTLFVVSNLRRFAIPRYDHELPQASRVMQQLPRSEVAYLAALFHDIAKGRGGDHSELGAVDAEAFCLEQGLGRYEARLVAWLVKNHLILSITSQKKDISDPDIIHDFARRVGDQVHLDYLYVLTVADVRGTNPKLWNAWKARLFEQFYERTKRALRRGLETPVDQEELIRETQEQARAKMPEVPALRVSQVWGQWTEAYFLRYTPEEIAWQTALLADRHPLDDTPLVAIRQLTDRGGTAVLTYAPRRLRSFARTTAVLDQMGLNVVDARLITSANGFSLETYVVLEDNGAVIADAGRIREIEQGLWRNLQQPEDSPATVTRRAPRQVRMFSTPTQVNFSGDSRNGRTILELVAADRPGLLSEVGKVFRTERVAIIGAKIMTVGERAEDVFYITDAEGRLLQEETCRRVQESLVRALDRRDASRG